VPHSLFSDFFNSSVLQFPHGSSNLGGDGALVTNDRERKDPIMTGIDYDERRGHMSDEPAVALFKL
jgi:hypothetical protein